MSTHLPGFKSFLKLFVSVHISQIRHQQHKGSLKLDPLHLTLLERIHCVCQSSGLKLDGSVAGIFVETCSFLSIF